MKPIKIALLLAVVAFSPISVSAQRAYDAAPLAPMAQKQARLLSGQIAANNVDKLTKSIHWYTSLSQAEAAAQRQNKMIVWVHMLGQLNGAT